MLKRVNSFKRLSRLSRLCYAVRPSRASISCVHLVRPSNASVSCASISCVYLVRPSCASVSFVSFVLCCASISCVCLVCLVCVMLCVHLVRLSNASVSCASISCVCSSRFILFVSFILPPEQFDPFDPFHLFHPFQAFDSYYPLSNSSVSIPSICLPPHAFQRVKINFFKLMGKPELFEVFNSV